MSATQDKSSSGIISTIYNSRTTLVELLREQKYDVSDYENFGVNEIHAMYTNKDASKQLDMICSSNQGNTSKKKVYVKYHLGKTLRVENIQDYIDDLYHIEKILDNKTDTLIIVIKQEINQTLMNILNEFWDKNKVFIIIFTMERLLFNILQHQYVPKHTILNE